MDGPSHVLLDARERGLDAAGLRRWARSYEAAAGAAHISRAYRHPLALIAWHEQPVGIDIERIEPSPPEFAQSICTPREWSAQIATTAREVISLWSGKEALAKALGDALGYDPRRLESPAAWRHRANGPWRAAPVPVPDGYCAWVCWRVPPPSPARAVSYGAEPPPSGPGLHSSRYARNRDRRRPMG